MQLLDSSAHMGGQKMSVSVASSKQRGACAGQHPALQGDEHGSGRGSGRGRRRGRGRDDRAGARGRGQEAVQRRAGRPSVCAACTAGVIRIVVLSSSLCLLYVCYLSLSLSLSLSLPLPLSLSLSLSVCRSVGRCLSPCPCQCPSPSNRVGVSISIIPPPYQPAPALRPHVKSTTPEHRMQWRQHGEEGATKGKGARRRSSGGQGQPTHRIRRPAGSARRRSRTDRSPCRC